MKICIASVSTQYGDIGFAAKNIDALNDKIYKFVKEWWNEVQDYTGDIGLYSRDEAVKNYFEYHDNEFLLLVHDVDFEV